MRTLRIWWIMVKVWLIHKLGGITRDEHIRSLSNENQRLQKIIAQKEKLYQDARNRVEFHVLRDTFGNQDTARRRDDFVEYLFKCLSSGINVYFSDPPSLGDTHSKDLENMGKCNQR